MCRTLKTPFCPVGPLLAGALGLMLVAGCEKSMRNMYDQPKYEPFVASRLWPDGRSERPLEPGVVAYGSRCAGSLLERTARRHRAACLGGGRHGARGSARHDRIARARAPALRRVLRALPQRQRRRRRHGRKTRIPGAGEPRQRRLAGGIGRAPVRCDHQRTRRDVPLRRSDRSARPLGDRRVRCAPCSAAGTPPSQMYRRTSARRCSRRSREGGAHTACAAAAQCLPGCRLRGRRAAGGGRAAGRPGMAAIVFVRLAFRARVVPWQPRVDHRPQFDGRGLGVGRAAIRAGGAAPVSRGCAARRAAAVRPGDSCCRG